MSVLVQAEKKTSGSAALERAVEVRASSVSPEQRATDELATGNGQPAASSEVIRRSAMAELNQQQVVDYIKGISVLELSQLVKALESELGVSAAAAMPMAMPAGGGAAAGGGGAGRGADRVHRDADGSRREQDQRHQGRPRSHQPRAEGSQGPGRRRAQGDQGRRDQGRGGGDQEEVRGRRREGRNQVDASRRRRAAPRRLSGARARDSGLVRTCGRRPGPFAVVGCLLEVRARDPSPESRAGRESHQTCTASPRTFTASASTSAKSRRRSRSRT